MTGVEQRNTDLADQSSSVARAGLLMRLMTTLPGRRDDAVAVVNGLFGDALDERGSTIATPMTIRAGTTVLPLERDALGEALAGAVPHVGRRLCLLVHGLMSTESIWEFPSDRSTTYGTLLARDHEVTPLSLRYNSGRHISTNGRELAHLTDRLVRAWPVPVREINLVGHSMGGLVVRSACHYGRFGWPRGRRLPFGRRWTSRVRRVVLLGVPNRGAPLEVLVNRASSALWSLPLPPTRLLGLGLDRRSAGIKDLRFGAVLDEDWQERDPASREPAQLHRARRPPRADHLLIAGSVTTDPEHWFTGVVGDALVTPSSAGGRDARANGSELFPKATSRVFPRVTHLALAHHPDVYDAIDAWWTSAT